MTSSIIAHFSQIATEDKKKSNLTSWSWPTSSAKMSDSIQIMSDLHLETSFSSYKYFKITPKAPCLALLGDIGNTKDPGLFTFLSTQLTNFKLVFMLLGNHEPYHSNWQLAKEKMIAFEKESDIAHQKSPSSLGRFIFLDQRRFDISETVTVLGCTLFSRVPGEHAAHVGYNLNDFYQIEDWTVTRHNEAFKSDLCWLNEQVLEIEKEEPERKLIVFTHHGPTIDPRVSDPAHVGTPLSHGFLSDLRGEACWKSNNVKVWAFGHTHWNCDFLHIEVEHGREMRVLTEQRGYYSSQSKGFEGGKVVGL